MNDSGHMARFWDERARENALFYVDNRLDYKTGSYASDDPDDFWTKGRRDFDAILEAVGAPEIGPDDALLDIGCGVGRMTRAAAAKARQVTGIDVSAEMVELARHELRDLQNVELLVGDGTGLTGVADASVDVVFSVVVFQHIPDPEITLGYVREIGRVLRPGGWAAFQVSDDPAVHEMDLPRAGGLRGAVARLRGTEPRGQDDPAWRGSAVDLARLAAVAQESGTAVANVVGRGTQFCYVLLRREA
ncbi:class I SAM-dependent methyltransferase [Patulibacter sp. NPDC049589]|uniref:class I SAM-dependent methyltransferase n=1 Tax=Patulibacter sp. NPDC049589 TaxID=3154731 RepID=UPI0034431E6D